MKLASPSTTATSIFERIRGPMFSETPNSLGPAGPFTQTTYYLGEDCLASREDIAVISNLIEDVPVLPENTRLRKNYTAGTNSYDILQASVEETETNIKSNDKSSTIDQIRLVRGDHKEELQRVCHYLREAMQYSSNSAQHQMLEKIYTSFMTGDLEAYKDSQRVWVNDKGPAVETVIGFVEPYRDPLGVRGEFEGIVGIADLKETKKLYSLATMANILICRLPWVEGRRVSKGPFEKEMFEPPDFSSVQSTFSWGSLRYNPIS